MSNNSTIEWTQSTWNPVTGCSKISPGCKNCYAARLAERLRAMGNPSYRKGFELTMHDHLPSLPQRWKKSRIVFVNSMSDLFHKEAPLGFIKRVFATMLRADWHQCQILTKRSGRLRDLSPHLPWLRHIWMGVSVENQDTTFRIDDLRQTRAQIKFLSLEPLLGPFRGLDLQGIDWVIVGGESGPKARPMEAAWALEIRDQCLAAGVPFFFKQWGGHNKKKTGRLLDGRTWDDMPLKSSKENRHEH